MNIYIGIDPGASGGIAMLDAAGAVVKVTPLHGRTDGEILNALTELDGRISPTEFTGLSVRYSTRAVIEHVWSTPGQGGAFAFGKSVGGLLMALAATATPFDQVLPRKWQKALDIAYPKGATDTEKKNITKRRAQQLFPTRTITHATADALLIAEYCRRTHMRT